MVGFAGLPVTLATLEAGRRLALANKESLIAAGPVVQRARAHPGRRAGPGRQRALRHPPVPARPATTRPRSPRIVLTASGGPFRGRTAAELADVTVDDALAHPTWKMGPKITVDSSTLMNKGLEVIEANELFGAAGRVSTRQIDVVVHPQSIVHSMVEFTDGATIAQLSLPDMRLPIGYALAYPDRVGTPFGAHRLGRRSAGSTSSRPTSTRSPASASPTRPAGPAGPAPAWLNAANEVAVEAFLDGRIRWIAIADVLTAVLDRHDGTTPTASTS